MDLCQACCVEAPTRYVAFYQNIGMLVMRQMRSVEGHLCRPCIRHHFLSLTLWGLVTGWWGMISFLINPFLILNNVVRYLTTLGLEPPPEGLPPPRLADETIARLRPLNGTIAELLQGRSVAEVAQNIAGRAGVSPGQAVLYVRALIEAARAARDPGSRTS